MKRHDLSISNLGREPIPSRYGNLTIEAFRGAACLPGEIVVSLCTLDEIMHVTLAVGDNVVMGHNVMCHALSIGDGAALGNGAIVNNDAVIGDLHEIVPAISAEIRKARGT